MRRFEIPYGKNKVNISIFSEESSIQIMEIETNEPQCLSNDIQSFLHSLDFPIETNPLSSFLKEEKKELCIVIDDFTRKSPPNKFLEALIDYIKITHKFQGKIKIMIANGTHKVPSESELKFKLGNLVDRFEIYTNDQSTSNFVNLGTTSSGTPVEINSEYLKSDIKILFTDITLHYFAGFGGDRKSIHPGLASKRTTNQNHSMVIKGLSAPGKLKNNPIHEDMLEAAKMAGADFVINMCFNSSNELFSVYSGSLNSAFEKACSDYLQRYAVSIKAQADLLIISPGGSPYDINLYQSQKALMQCSKCVKEGAPIIFMNEAAGGIGNSVFEQWNEKYRIKDEIIRAIETHFEQGANNVLNQRNFTERNKIYIYTSLPGGIVSAFGMEKIDDLNEIVHKLTQNTSLIYIIKNGSKMMINRN